MRKVLLLCCALIAGIMSFSQTTIFNEDFESAPAPGFSGWTTVNGAANGRWATGTTTKFEGNQSAYISSTPAGTNSPFSYVNSLATQKHLYRDVTVPSGEGCIALQFDWKCLGEINFDYMRVFVAPTTFTPVDGTAPSGAGVVQVGLDRYAGAISYVHESIIIPASLAGTTFRLIFTWRTDGSGGTSPASLDNVLMTSRPTSNPTALSGSKTIGGGSPDYATFRDALLALNTEGVGTGGVTFSVRPGTYGTDGGIEKDSIITFSPVYNASASNRISFVKESGPVTIERLGTIYTGPSQFENGYDYLVGFTGADYITLDGIDVMQKTGNTGVDVGYFFRNLNAVDGCTNNIVQNTNITLNRANAPVSNAVIGTYGILSTTTTGVPTGGGTGATSAAGANSGNKFYNLNIKNSYYGVYLLGTAGFPDLGNEIGTTSASTFNVIGDGSTANDIGNGTVQTYGIRMGSQSGFKVFNNNISNVTASAAQADGILVEVFQGNSQVYNNNITGIRNASTSSTTAISGIRATHATTGTHTINIYNNFVSNINSGYTGAVTATRTLKGIFLSGTGGGTGQVYNVFFNSVRIDASGSANLSNTAFEIGTATGPVYNVKSNIFSNFTGAQTGVAKHYTWVTTSTTAIGNTGSTSDFNDLYVQNTTNGFTGLASTTDKGTLTLWRGTANTDISSISVDPMFASNTDLHINSGVTSIQLESGGTAVGGIIVDFDGQARPGPGGSVNGGGTTVDIGADEFDGVPLDLTAPSISYTLLANNSDVSSYTTANFATITDFSGVDAIPGTAPRLYFKRSTDNNDLASWKFVESASPTSPFDFLVDYSQIPGGVVPGNIIQYFVVAQDRASTPNVGINFGNFTTAQTSVNLQNNAFPILGTLNSYVISPTYAGDINVGTAETITSITNTGGLFDKLNNGIITGNLTVHITSNLAAETGTVALNQPTETGGGGYTITIKPDAAYAVSGTSTTSLIKLNGSDRIVIDGSTSGGTDRSLTITNNSTGTSSAVIWLAAPALNNGANNNTIKNCIIQGNASTTTLFCIYVGGASATLSISAAGNEKNNNNSITNNLFRKSQYGVAFFGYGTTTPDDNNIVNNNNFGTAVAGEGFSLEGIHVERQNSMLVYGNEVQGVIGTTGTNMYGIRLLDFKNGQAYANSVHDISYTSTSTPKIYGIAVQNPTYTTVGNPSLSQIYNNFIYKINSTGTSAVWNVTGLLTSGGYGDKFYHNSIHLTGAIANSSSGLSAAFANGDGNLTTVTSNIEVRNNIISLTGSSATAGGSFWAYYTSATTLTGTVINNNILYCNGTGATNYIGRFNGTNSATINAWQTATGQEANSFSVNPPFTSATDLHINSGVTATLLESTGATVGIVSDIDGQTRPGPTAANGGGTAPDMGADEFDGVPVVTNDIQATAFITPLTGGTVGAGVSFAPQASFTNNGTATQTSVTVRYRILDNLNAEIYNQTTTIASISSLSTATATFPSATLPSAGAYTIFAKAELAGDQATGNDQISGTLTGAAPLSGTYFVGASQTAPHFTNLTNAVAALNSLGASSAVIFKLKADYVSTGETFPITINVYPGASSTNTATIMPDASVTASITGSSTSSIFKLNGADYVTIDGSNSGGTDKSLTITNSSTAATTAAIWVASLGTGAGATNNTFKNLNIATGTSSSSTFGIAIGGATIGSTGADNDNITVQNNAITVASTGIYAIGNAAVSTAGLDNLTITDNSITHNGSTTPVYGIRAGGGLNGSIANNILDIQTSASTALVGISLETDFVSASVTRNKINRLTTSATGGYGGRGITVGTGTASSAITISNNMITGVNGSNWTGFTNSSSMGIVIGAIGNSTTLTTTTGGVNIYYNSVNLYGNHSFGSATVTAALYVGSGATALDVRNNIFVNSLNNTTTAGSINYGVYSAAAASAFTNINYNDYYLPSTANSTGKIGFLGSDQATLALWKTATTQEANSLNVSPVFTSNTDLHIGSGPSGNFLESAGTAIGGITTDIDGNTRPGPAGSVNGGGTAPDMGADEFDGALIIPCTIPAAQPTSLNLTPTTTTVSGSFTAASPVADFYLVVRTTASSLAGLPVDATSYTVGANTYFGTGGYVESIGNSTTISSTGLTQGTTYYYWVFSYNNNCTGGPVYRTTSPLSGSVATTAIFTSIATGNWDDGTTWNQSGAIPGSANDVIIANGHNVSLSGTDVAATVTVNTGGTLTASSNSLALSGASTTGLTANGTVIISGGTVTVGPAGGSNRSVTVNSAATLTVSSGTLNVNGNLSIVSGATFTQSGGAINVDGNAAGNAANSVAASTPIVNLAASTGTAITLSGGVFTIVDPHANATLTNTLAYNNSSVTGTAASTSHTFRFGDGVSTDAGGNAEGFKYFSWVGTGILKMGNLILNGPAGTNRIFSAASSADTYNNLVVSGDMTINSGAEYRNQGTAITAATFLGGNLTVNTGGTFTSANTVYFGSAVAAGSTTLTLSAATVAQTVSGAGTFQNAATSPTGKFAIITVNNTNITGVTFASAVSPVTMNGAFTVTTGTVTLDGLTLNGTTAQTVPLTAAASIINVKDFVLNNTAGATLSGSGKLNVSNTATITAGTLAAGTGGRLVLKSSALGTARIPAIAGAITGTVTAETYIPGGRRAFRFLGHPFTGALDMTSLKDNIYVTGAGAGFDATLTNNPSAYWYNNVSGTWTAFATSTDASWTQYRGIRVLVRGDRTQTATLTGSTELPNAVTLDVTGTLNTGVANVSLPTAGNYHLVSNPYPSPTDIGTVIDAQSATVGTQYWVWDANASTKGAYVVRSVGGGAYNLAMGASFVAQPASSTTLAFTEANKTAASTASLFRTNPKGLLELQLLYNNYPADNLFVKLNEKSAAAMEATDGNKLINTDMNFYTLSSNNTKLSLDARPLDKEDVIKLGLTTNVNTVYKIKVSNYGFSNDVTMYLKDKYTNTLTPVDENMEYSFEVNSSAASQGEDRFELVMKQVPLLTLTTSFDVTITPNPVSDQMVINYSSPEKGQAVVRIFSAEGKAVKTAELGTVNQMGRTTISVKGMAAGVYNVELTIGKERVTKQIVKL
jgi:hypothetical protein